MADPRLVDATLRVIAEHGLDGVTIERLADAAGISRATLYRRAVDKDELLVAALDKAVDGYRAALWPALTGPGSARQRLEAALRALCEAAEPYLPLLASLYPHPHSPFHDDTDQGPALVREPFAEPFERLLRDGQLDGTLHTTDPVVDATVLYNLISWTYIHLRHAHNWEANDTADRVISLILGGLDSPDVSPDHEER